LKIRISYAKFKNYLTGNDYLIGAMMYMGIPDDILPKKRRFLHYLTSQGFILQTRPLMIVRGKKIQKQLDIFIYRDIVELAHEDSYDKAILVSGDADFIEIVKKIKELGKIIEIWSFKKSLSSKLLREAGQNAVHYINDILSDIAC
jgi:uncharacterized LabA/DUF88 family protein